MRENSMQFSEAQTDILKDVGNYTKTRFNIIGLSVKNLLAEDQDFFDLLLLLSVIDAKNIPRATAKPVLRSISIFPKF